MDLSAHQKRRIERRFRDFWLPRLFFTVYEGSWFSADYKLVGQEDEPVNGSANASTSQRLTHFHLVEPEGFRGDRDHMRLEARWQQYRSSNRTANLRLGENYLNEGFRGGYIVDDTGLSGLRVENEAKELWFDWFGTFDQLMREEAMRTKTRNRMLEEEMALWEPDHPSQCNDSEPGISIEAMVKILVLKIQMASRVKVYKHRVHRYDPSGATQPAFRAYSQKHHKQTPTVAIPEHARRGCFCCSRTDSPDIFEVVSQEECSSSATGVEKLTW